ncbi:MAG: bifunctional riboflavin kinase/FAD synthetase [Sandaracinaceae bacterium]|nr:bifunctional riboflavin kinase/FAD synthetase [Sandaracinaceae bacterium]
MGSSTPTPSVVVPGNHDGVHRGHVALLARARELAAARGARVVALTFDPHPLALIAPERAPTPLTTIERRAELLVRAGADDVVVARFDRAYAELSAEDFVSQELVARLGACAVLVGADYRFGKGRKGEPGLLRALGAEGGFDVEVIDAVGSGAVARISSTTVREALREGDLARTRELLGRVHELEGVVVEGHRRGRTIGFPTANLEGVKVMLPPDGVYAIVARVLEGPRASEPLLTGMLNVGTRPTFAAGRSIEAHLFDVSRDLYGQRLRLGLVARLRDERRFDGVEALVAQLREDETHARQAVRALATDTTVLV